jgi:uncharacterized oxidoreductase
MPTIQAARLKDISIALFTAAGASEEEAEIVARHCVGAKLAGHDSHGVMRVVTYIDRIEKGHIVPGAEIEIERETPTTLVVNGNWGFGFVVTETITKKLIEKAKTQNVAVGTIHYQSHIGRLADYPLMAAAEGMIGMITADSGRSPKRVAPFGGREPKLGTNPISMAFPSNLKDPFFFDLATCAGAAGKLDIAEARGEQVPEGWLIDKDGVPTTDPAASKAGGAILPLGGREGYKGYALAAMVEIMSGLLTGLGFGVEPTGKHNDGVFMAVYNVEAFRSLETFKTEVTEFAKYLGETAPMEGTDQVLYPGQIESIRAAKNLEDGIYVEDPTWENLKGLAEKYGVADKVDFG